MGHPVIFRHVVEVLGKVNLENNDFEVREGVKKDLWAKLGLPYHVAVQYFFVGQLIMITPPLC